MFVEEMLGIRGFVGDASVRLVRHQEPPYDLHRLWRTGMFEPYQAAQGRDVFGASKTLVSFLGLPGTHALFVGVYDVLAVRGPVDITYPADFPYQDMQRTGMFAYTLARDCRYKDLEGRLVIDWGAGTRSWAQHYRPGTKPVIELLPTGYVREFPGFMDVVLPFDELRDIVLHPTPHRSWHQMLRSVAGIYLILDQSSGAQYVGSAYGADGLLGRWKTYVETGHGDNVQLKRLVAVRPAAAQSFQFSVLQTLPITLTKNEVIAFETLHKRKLGSRAHGLNSN